MVVNIPRKLVRITKKGNVSITIATRDNEFHSAILTPESAEALAYVILEAAETAKKGA